MHSPNYFQCENCVLALLGIIPEFSNDTHFILTMADTDQVPGKASPLLPFCHIAISK